MGRQVGSFSDAVFSGGLARRARDAVDALAEVLDVLAALDADPKRAAAWQLRVRHNLQHIDAGNELDLMNHVPFQDRQKRTPLLFVGSIHDFTRLPVTESPAVLLPLPLGT